MNMYERFVSIWSAKTPKQIKKEIESLQKYMQKHDAHYVLHGKSHAPDKMSDRDRLRALRERFLRRKRMPSDYYVDLRHLGRIAEDVDNLSACVIRAAINEIEYKRIYTTKTRDLLKEMLEAWEYFSEYDVPIGMKESIEKLLLKL